MASIQEQLEALRDLSWLYSQARTFYKPQRFEDTDAEGMRSLWREATKAYLEASQKIEAAKKKLLATGFDVPDSWLTVRAVGRVGMSESLLEVPKRGGKKKSAGKPKTLAVLTDTGADLDALDAVCKEIYVAALRLGVQQGDVGGGAANPNLPLQPQTKAQRAAEYIREHPGEKASVIAKYCEIQTKSFIAHIAPVLKKMGVTSRRGCEGGYYPPGYKAKP
jgi:hypothetical protein